MAVKFAPQPRDALWVYPVGAVRRGRVLRVRPWACVSYLGEEMLVSPALQWAAGQHSMDLQSHWGI